MKNEIIEKVLDAAMKSSGHGRDKYFKKMGPGTLRTKRMICFVIMNELGIPYSKIAGHFSRNSKALQHQCRDMKAQIKLYADLKEIYDTIKKDMGTGAPSGTSHAAQ